jgi:hypothetical protein
MTIHPKAITTSHSTKPDKPVRHPRPACELLDCSEHPSTSTEPRYQSPDECPSSQTPNSKHGNRASTLVRCAESRVHRPDHTSDSLAEFSPHSLHHLEIPNEPFSLKSLTNAEPSILEEGISTNGRSTLNTISNSCQQVCYRICHHKNTNLVLPTGLFTPGIRPSNARFRKQIRQILNLR